MTQFLPQGPRKLNIYCVKHRQKLSQRRHNREKLKRKMKKVNQPWTTVYDIGQFASIRMLFALFKLHCLVRHIFQLSLYPF